MSQIDESKNVWPHTPIQVQPENPQGAFHVMPQGTWRLPVQSQFTSFVTKPPLFGSEWNTSSNWTANNNKLGEWDVARPVASFGSTSSNGTDVQVDVDSIETDEKPEEAKEQVTAVEPEVEDMEIDTVETKPKIEPTEVKQETTPSNEMSTTTMEESQLLLNFSQQLTEPKVTSLIDAVKKELPTTGFLHSGSSAFSNIEPSNRSVSPVIQVAEEATAQSPAAVAKESMTNEVTSVVPLSTNSSFCRPPGLGPVDAPPPANGQAAPLVCPICGFSCTSKFHYNSHMNTHGDHQCTMCDYTSRTEGRLKKHMRESHTIEEQLKAGLEIDPKPTETNTRGSPKLEDTGSDGQVATSSNSFMLNLSTTMASILDSTANAFAASMASSDVPSSLPTSLNLDISGAAPNLLSSFNSTALDQIRAFTEKSSLIPDCSINLASTLGEVSQVLNGERKSPEKNSSSGSVSRRSSNTKVKIRKCKQCGHKSLSQDDHWDHIRIHIPPEKQLDCTQCKFVTEYKHHLEYHLRNHIGSKPFQCKKCAYQCVNKSMLNSHSKSHTNIYQFRCMDCTYATKYCHSLKQHLKKYTHRRLPEEIEMNGGDSSPTSSNNDAIPAYPPAFPNLKVEKKFDPTTSIAPTFSFPSIVTTQNLNYASQMLLKHHQMDSTSINPLLSLQNLNNISGTSSMAAKCPMCEVQCATPEEQIRHNMSHFLNSSVPTTLASLYNNLSSHMPVIAKNGTSISSASANTNGTETSMEVDSNDEPDVEHEGSEHGGEEEMMDHISECPNSPTGSSKTSTGSCGDDDSQKQKAFDKLEEISQRLQGKSPTCSDSLSDKDDERHMESSLSPAEQINEIAHLPLAVQPANAEASSAGPLVINTAESGSLNNLLHCLAFNVLNTKRDEGMYDFICPHCRMSFHDQALYHIHMGYHGYEHAFKCNRCGYTANDSLKFNLHLFEASHE